MRDEHCRAGLTLIELLVVIVIIMVLAGLLFPTLYAAKEKAKIRRARAETRELAKACQVLYDTYGEWRLGNSVNMDVTAVSALGGLLALGDVRNPGKIRFMDFTPEAMVEGFKDPWGHLYTVEFDTRGIRTNWVYETRVAFPNRKRYLYE